MVAAMSDKTTRSASAGRMRIDERTAKMISPSSRRSPRIASTNKAEVSPKATVKRSIVVRKIVPRKTQVTEMPTAVRRSPRGSCNDTLVSLDENKENVNRSSETQPEKRKKPSPPPTPARVSPVVVPPPTQTPPPLVKPSQDARSLEWSQKVRRSYSRVSVGEGSPQSPLRRDSLFGFEHLQTPPVATKTSERSRVHADTSASFSTSSISQLEGSSITAGSPEVDVNIPGVVMVKEKKRRVRAPQIKMSDLDLLAAKMNAEFEEAECFDLVIE